jgi:signal transduction histidine kinase
VNSFPWPVHGIVAGAIYRSALDQTMEIKVVSGDSDVRKLCAEILPEIDQDRQWLLSTASLEALGGPADLYIWDYQPNVALPKRLRWTYSNVVVLAHRREMAEVQKLLGFEPNVVLKPVARATLSALVGFAVSNQGAVSLRDDRDRLFQCLIEANLKLQEYDHDRTNFLTHIIHDFRAPLTALSGYSGLLLNDPVGSLNENQREIVRRMQYSTKRLLRMASSMLQLGMDRRVKRRLDLQRGDLQRSLDQAFNEISPLAEDKKLKITSALAPCDGGLYFDPVQISQVLMNILDNACKVTPRNGVIEIRGYPFFWERRREDPLPATLPKERRICDSKEPNSYRLDIRDTGPGIAQDHLESIFEEYTSYSGARDRSAGGLGLAICKMIIDTHGGRVWAENSESGPVFSFVVPKHRVG